MTQGQFKTYADHNVVTFTGRVAAADLRQSKNGEFLSVALITNLVDDGIGVELRFNTSAGLLGFVKKNYQLRGRLLTITGHISGVEATYFDKQTEQTVMLKRPRLVLSNVTVMPGGIGAPPKSADTTKTTKVVVKPSQAKQELTPEEAYSDNEADASVAPMDEVPAF